jgi:trehalose 6-phosphate synthase/phosphatase
MEEVSQKIRGSEKLLLLLDYDGTLVPFASKPELAAPDDELKDLLRRLAERPRTSVHLLSGRTRGELEQWFGDLPVGLHAEHGFWSRSRPGQSWNPLLVASFEWKEKVLPILEDFVVRTPGALIEEKAIGFAWHYRLADSEMGAAHAERLRLLLEEKLQGLPIEVLTGAKVIEVRLQGVNKGVIASRLISREQGEPTILALGDDTTDEDLFAALPEGALAVHIGPRASIARYRVEDCAAARKLLAGILEAEPQNAGKPQSVAVSG